MYIKSTLKTLHMHFKLLKIFCLKLINTSIQEYITLIKIESKDISNVTKYFYFK